MPTQAAYGDSRLSFWLRARRYAVPPTMIMTATARRGDGDWAGACAAAHVDVDLDLRALACHRGRELASRIRADLRRLAPDLLRWHLPRIAPDGLLRPGLTVALARYQAGAADGDGPLHLVVRTAPAWAAGGQRISLALWDASHPDSVARRHPRPRPHPRFRLDLHRHLWDADRSDELRARSGADRPPGGRCLLSDLDPALLGGLPPEHGWAVDRWADEAAILLRADGIPAGAVAVRLGARRRLVLEPAPGSDGAVSRPPRITAAAGRGSSALPVLPDAATWVPPDLELLRAGLVRPDQLHPLVASALAPDGPPRAAPPAPAPLRGGRPHVVDCRGERHRIALVDGVLTALDHDPAEIRREELLAALTGTPLPCIQAVDQAHRRPDCLPGIRERLDHGDTAGALAVVEDLLGPGALLRGGPLRDALEAAVRRRIAHGLFRAGLTEPGPGLGVDPGARRPARRASRADRRSTVHRHVAAVRRHPRHATFR